MIVLARTLLTVLLLTLCFGPTAHADEAQDALVEQGVAAYDDGDYQRAKDILLPLAKAGHPEAMHIIGRLHEGLGGVFPKDPKMECDWYEKAALKGLVKSMYNYSHCYDFIPGREKNREHMLEWLTRAAEHGHIRAMINLAAEDETYGEEYRHWMNIAANHGSRYAMVRLWNKGYKHDVPDLSIRDITCTYIHILIFDEDIYACDNLR